MRGDPHLQALAPYLISGPHSNMIGLYHLPMVYPQGNLGWPLKAITRCFARLAELGFIRYDDDTEHVLVFHAWRIELCKEDMKPDDNRRYEVARLLHPLLSNPLVPFFLGRYPATRQALIGLLPVGHIPLPPAPPPSPSPQPQGEGSRATCARQEQGTWNRNMEQEQKETELARCRLRRRAPAQRHESF